MANEIVSAEVPGGGLPNADAERGEPVAAGLCDRRDLPSSACGCRGEPRLVYVLGQLGCHMASHARAYAFVQKINGHALAPDELRDFDRKELLKHLVDKPWEADAVEWTIERD